MPECRWASVATMGGIACALQPSCSRPIDFQWRVTVGAPEWKTRLSVSQTYCADRRESEWSREQCRSAAGPLWPQWEGLLCLTAVVFRTRRIAGVSDRS